MKFNIVKYCIFLAVALAALGYLTAKNFKKTTTLNPVRLAATPLEKTSNDDRPDTVIFTDGFDNYRVDSIYPPAVPILQKQGLDPKQLAAIPIPKNWTIEWSAFPKDCQFGETEKHFFVRTAGKFTMYGANVTPASQEYTIEITAGVPAGANLAEAVIQTGIFEYGLTSFGPRITGSVKIAKGETKTFKTTVRFEKDFAPFRPMLVITGDVILERMVVAERPEQFSKMGLTLLEGTLKECSQIPDPAKSDYPNCRFTCHFVGNSIQRGAPCPQETVLVIEGFANKKLLASKQLTPGDKIRCLILPFDKLSAEQKTTQQADDLNLFSLDNYYVLGFSKITSFSDLSRYPASGINFSDNDTGYVSVFERNINPPITPQMSQLQAAAIAADLASIDSLLSGYTDAKKAEINSRFNAQWKLEKDKDPPGRNRVKNFVWRNVDGSFWALPETFAFIINYPPIAQEKIDAVVALRDFLAANGCQLIVSLVPGLYDISARVINQDFRDIPDFTTAAVTRQLLDNGIETIYASPQIIKHFNRYPWAFFYPANPHPSDTVQDVLTDLVAAKLSRYQFAQTMKKELFTIDLFEHAYGKSADYLFPDNCDIGANKPKSAYLCRRVLYDGKTVNADPQSPILIIGNSFIQTPMDFPDSFPTLLSAKLSTGVTSYRVGSFGPMTAIIQQLFAAPEEMLKGKKVVVLGFGATFFLSPVGFNNIREMDRQSLLLSGKSPVATLEVNGETKNGTSRYLSLPDVRIFEICKDGPTVVAGIKTQSWDAAKPTVAVIPVCIDATNLVNLKVNGQAVNVPSCHGYLRWVNIVVPLAAGTDSVTIEATGPAGNEFAVRNIQLFQ